MDEPLRKFPGLKQRDVKPCCGCGRGVMHGNNLTFYRLSLEHMVANLGAIQRQHGLEQMVGNAAIAQAMGTDEDIARAVSTHRDALLCLECAVRLSFTAILEKLQAASEAAETPP